MAEVVSSTGRRGVVSELYTSSSPNNLLAAVPCLALPCCLASFECYDEVFSDELRGAPRRRRPELEVRRAELELRQVTLPLRLSQDTEPVEAPRHREPASTWQVKAVQGERSRSPVRTDLVHPARTCALALLSLFVGKGLARGSRPRLTLLVHSLHWGFLVLRTS